MATLGTIKTKVRRLTRSPSQSQLTDDQLGEYINDFVLYDLPEHIRLFTFRETLTFYAVPYVDTYRTNGNDPESPLYNFKNKYVTVHPPVYIGGYKAYFTQSRSDFFNKYPRIYTIKNIGTGDGNQQTYTGTLSSTPILRNHVYFTSTDGNANGMVLRDVPRNNVRDEGDLIDTQSGANAGTINYINGNYTANFQAAPGDGEKVDSQVYYYQPGIPTALLYYNNEFTVRPIPNRPYPVNVEVYRIPSSLDDDDDRPELDQLWEYIAYGAARKVFEDRMDSDSLQFILPIFQERERMALRRTLVQQSNERVSTIYEDNTANAYGSGWYKGGGLF